ncbi:MAG: hypothetical protein WAT61_00625, partial [Flavobacteriales bacterium]
MRTFTLLSIAASFALSTSVSAQLPRIVVDGITAPQVFTDLNAAITAAPANSNITLSGGSFLVPGGFALDKPLHFVGAGMHPDSTNATGATILVADGYDIFALTSGASGSSFTGIWFNNAGNVTLSLGTGPGDQVVTGVEFLRCMFQKEVRLGVEEPSNSSSSFTECIFHGVLRGNGGTSVVNRCIFDYSPGTGGMIVTFRPSGLSLLNSIVLGGNTDACHYATISNCVFTKQGGGSIWQSNNTTVSNCIFSSSQVFSNSQDTTSIGNILNQSPSGIFVNEMDGSYQFTDDVHLAGGDGNGIGLYGGSPSYKPGGVP